MSTDAKITVNEWAWDDNEAKFIDPPDPESVYADYRIRNKYEKDGHIYVMGCTSPVAFRNASVAAIQLAHPVLLWIADWTAARFRQKPPIPDPRIYDSDWVLLDVHFETSNIVVGADGSIPYFRISGTYTYGHLNPPDNTLSILAFPRPPWLEDFAERLVPVEILEKELIDNNNGRPTGNPDFPVILGDRAADQRAAFNQRAAPRIP